MENNTTIEDNEVKKNYIFFHRLHESNTVTYYCKCGEKIKKDFTKEEDNEVSVSVDLSKGIDIEDLSKAKTSGNYAKIKCQRCELDYTSPIVYNNIKFVDKYFLETYKFVEDDNRLYLYKNKHAAFYNSLNDDIAINTKTSYIALNKVDKKLFFKDFTTQEEEFNLNKVFSVVKNIYKNDEQCEITDGLFDVHCFLNRLANFVSDSKNINIIDELMKQMIGRSGIDVLTKVTSIFLGIICYSNLSTIALTKGTVFLFDMLNNCILPNPNEFTDVEATSPLKIFNFLVNLKNKEIEKEVDSHDENKVGYLFKSKSGKSVNFLFKDNQFNTESTIVKSEGEVFVREDIGNIKVSPYIFNKLKNFSDYKCLIKYLKFISYQDLIEIVSKHDIMLLINLFDVIEFRDGMNKEKLIQIIHLAISHAKREYVGSEKLDAHFIRDVFIREHIKKEVSNKIEEVDETKIDYNSIKYFNLNTYDDCLRMILNLDWDPNKEFYKIKKINDLEEYHNQLIEHFSLLTNKEKNKSFVDFVSKFNYLEEYDGKLSIKTIKTPDILFKEALELKNCAASYVNRIAQCQYVLLIIYDCDNTRTMDEHQKFMLGLKITKNGLEFDQVKTYCNKQGSNRFKENVMEYLRDKDISYKELSDLKILKAGETHLDSFDINNVNDVLRFDNDII